MNIDTAVKNLKMFRKWFGGSGRKYVCHMPEGITHGQISESLKTIISFIPYILSIDELCRLSVAADDLLRKNRKEIIKGASEEEKHNFDTYISDLSKAIRNLKKIIRHLQNMQNMEANVKAK